ncbi:MAG: hypothetical protein OD811_03580 [Alphaproteobacteria bacterium]
MQSLATANTSPEILEIIGAVEAAKVAALQILPQGPRRIAVAWTFDQEIQHLQTGAQENFIANSPPPLDGLPEIDQRVLRNFMSRTIARSLFGQQGKQSTPAESSIPKTEITPKKTHRRDLTGV